MVQQNSKTLMIVTGELGSGGLEHIVSLISSYYITKKWNVVILSLLNPAGKIFVKIDPRVRVDFFNNGPKRFSSFRKFMSITQWVSFIKSDIAKYQPSSILAMTFKIGSLVVLADSKSRHRLVIREISDPKSAARSQIMNYITYHFSKRANAVIFQTDWERRCCPKSIQSIGSVIYNPISINCFSTCPKKNIVVTMGRLCNFQKRHDVLIKAFAIFYSTHPNYSLEIYGEGPDEQKDFELISSLGLLANVKLMGAKKNVHEFISDAKMFVLTSDFEGLSNALVEAMLMGIPSISSDWPGASEIINDHENGLLIKRNDVAGFANAMSIFADNSEIAERCSKKAIEMSPLFDCQSIMKAYSQVIEGIEND